MVKTKNSTPTSPPTTSTAKPANKQDAYTALGEPNDTLNLPHYLDMHASLCLTSVTETRLHLALGEPDFYGKKMKL